MANKWQAFIAALILKPIIEMPLPARTLAIKPLAIKRLLLGQDGVRRALYLGGMMPAMWYFYCGLTDQLGADPQKTLERLLGLWALRFLVLTLAITPLRRLGLINLIGYRRAVGLIAFYYAVLHLTVYTGLDQGFDLAAIVSDIVKRPYITVGMAAFVILVPLAITSNALMIRRLGGKTWQGLHRWVYAAAAAAAVHFIMVVKSWPAEPLIYAALIGILLLYRLHLRLQKPKRTRSSEPVPAA
jgi:methionine sulfoxide reductase heme-binding subunit